MPAGKGRGEPNAGRTCVRKTMAMLCRLREVPRHLLVCEKSNFGHEKSRHRHLVETHYHNYRVSFLIPECGILSKELKDLVMDSGPYYFVKDLPLHELIAHEFINTFVKKGACYALTYNTNIDEDNTVALLPNGAEGSTMMSYFSNYRIQERQPKIALSTVTDLPCPVLRSGELRGEPEAACSAQELFEWLGAVFSNAELNNEPDNFISTYCCPQPSTVAAKACLCTITGFILPEKIRLLLEQLCRYFDEPKLAPWVTLSVQGFADSPVSWRENEHGFRKGGEHLYNFVVFSNRDYWLQLAVGANDDCPP
ncbi:ribonuclease P protein subunit p40 isoform X3 [Delphinapterus leucas]|uniref:Ribonuclease P protein subunit p40 isoform X3 n=1 Tax=Delphinapterus leucas TaxID=9749 RepID=A0A2Y9P898_DELLE|nr:ribonuclease P protein subunit p40 isoform X3 [Delphinapterus leucas]